MGNPTLLIVIAAVMFAVIGGITLVSHLYNLNGIKSKTVGDGQHGTARFATKSEIRRTYRQVPPHGEHRQRKISRRSCRRVSSSAVETRVEKLLPLWMTRMSTA